NLAQSGMAQGDAGLLVASLEMLADVAPGGPGAAQLLRDIEEEARFAIRGDPILAARIDAALESLNAAREDLWIVRQAGEIALPPGRALRGVVVPHGQLFRAEASSGETCTPAGMPDRCRLPGERAAARVTLGADLRDIAILDLSRPTAP
ncbi:MAG: hypothetical protein AAGH70_07735, partial [Pseudomonadota bacterium]